MFGNIHVMPCVDIAERLGVSKPSVTKLLITCLTRVCNKEKYGTITLTDRGRCFKRSTPIIRCSIIFRTFAALTGEASQNACRMEHFASENISSY